jgi:DNA repair exonuclease SbcCD ATPase subunit
MSETEPDDLAEAREVVTATGRRLQARLDEVEERAGALEQRGRELDERDQELGKRGDELDRRERRLAEREQALERRTAELDARRGELETEARSLAEQRAAAAAARPPEPEPAPEPEPDAAPPAEGARGRYNVVRLEHLVEEGAERIPERAAELRSYVFFLRDHADVDGNLPATFDYLVEEVFEDVL